MYEYMNGLVTDVKSNGIVLETAGIGYFIYTANPFAFNENENYKVYLYQVVREDELSLFGFKKREEKELFLKLINVKGLGPKMALPILATGSISGIIDAINRENLLYIKKFPKIGDKLAKQIILDLKGKLVPKGEVQTNNFDELTEALKSLGYKVADINKITKMINPTDDIEVQIKEALKLLLK